MAVKLYYGEKDVYALLTDAPDELTFRQEFTDALTVLVEANTHKGEWALALHRWLGQFADICLAYQGLKPVATVETRILYTAGAVSVATDIQGGDVLPAPSILDVILGQEAPQA